jgi:hypothetical protein
MCHLANIDNTDNPVIYIFANPKLSNTTISIYKFNEDAMSLEIIGAKGDPPLSRYQLSAVSDYAGKFYLFGGGIVNTSPTVRSNEMNVYDSLNNVWNLNVIPSKDTLPILAYSATFLDGLILYIGGRSSNFMNKEKSIYEYSLNTVSFNS